MLLGRITTLCDLAKLQRRHRFSRPGDRDEVRHQSSWSEDQDPLVSMVLSWTGTELAIAAVVACNVFLSLGRMHLVFVYACAGRRMV